MYAWDNECHNSNPAAIQLEPLTRSLLLAYFISFSCPFQLVGGGYGTKWTLTPALTQTLSLTPALYGNMVNKVSWVPLVNPNAIPDPCQMRYPTIKVGVA